MKITVFTPTYNRVHTLQRLYESLCRQTCRDFEWLIIDDGSTDETEARVKSFRDKTTFPIRYLKKENGGKHTAYNAAVKIAMGEYFFCVDSDDYLADDALYILSEAILCYPDAIGIVALKTLSTGEVLCNNFPKVQYIKTLIQLQEEYNCQGEFSIVLKTVIAKQLPYPIFKGERFIGESVVYDKLVQYGRLALLNRSLTICEYQPDGYSASTDRLMRENPAGYCLYFMQRINLVSHFSTRLVMAGKYQCFGIMAGKKRIAYQGAHRLLTAACYPVGLLFRLYYKLFRGF